jgi:hypothetical protein
MRITMLRSYTSPKGNKTFVYGVEGTPEQLSQYEEVSGSFYRVDDETGQPLWFTTRCVGNTGKLLITKNKKIVPDMSAYDQADSLAKQYGGSLGNELARIAALALTGNASGAPTSTPAKLAVVKDNNESEEDKL